MKVLLVFGAHVDVYSALKALNKPTDFMPIPTIFIKRANGLSETALKTDRVPVLTTPGPGEKGKIWDLIEKAVEDARQAGKDLVVIEAVWEKPFERYAKLADYIFVNGRLFEVRA
ncbi:hypothetical protein OCC_02937 [Thermococcus litoralis DSM 5473]|uniref:Uncharacterized protein n=1 Tax=Thermococcus litoralis (strain ATCC 51850 / DSM 5473 / JCM 8560 / NS-C) TaxID=523849 RepID=H3ZQ09_THELN|nr:hypothetical protein [Thermococcus litoralis]EHR77972.1 hypothetical protein OCC_02937 [Thermococcus litoralis DSM 5473]